MSVRKFSYTFLARVRCDTIEYEIKKIRSPRATHKNCLFKITASKCLSSYLEVISSKARNCIEGWAVWFDTFFAYAQKTHHERPLITHFFCQTRVFLALCLFSFVFVHPVPNQELFLRANQAYEKGAYSEAKALYESIESKGPAVWFNMGNCFYQQGNLVDAIIAWRRAQKFGLCSLTQMAEKLIKQAQTALGVERVSTGQHLYRTILLMIPCIGLLFLQIIFLLFLALLLVFFRRLWRSIGGTILMLIWSLVLLISCIGIMISWYDMNHRQAVIKEARVNIYAGPGTDYHVVGSCMPGSEFVIEQERGVWYKMQCPHARGWLQKETCEII